MGEFWQFLFGLKDAKSITAAPELTFAEHWAAGAPAWVFFGCVGLAVLGIVSYLKFEPRIRDRRRFWGAALRALVLAALFFVAADPILKISYRQTPKPLVYLLFDGSESMAIRDRFEAAEQRSLCEAAGIKLPPGSQPPSRMEYIQGVLSTSDFIADMNKKAHVRAFAIDRQGVHTIKSSTASDGAAEGKTIAAALTATAPLTPLGKAIEDIALEYKRDDLGAVVMFSDFNKNSGPDPDGPAGRLARPIYTVGLGPVATRDLSVKMTISPVLKKAERDVVSVSLQQSQLDGQTVTVRVMAEPLTAEGAVDKSRQGRLVGERQVTLRGARASAEIPFIPDEVGRVRLTAKVEPVSGESVEENNASSREVNIRDDFMRLLYVAYEPNWEWRFIKEVFHRDKLVGMRGFRTFLFSSDPDVRRTNPLFTPRIDSNRGEFFANDVIFLGDVPADALTGRFCDNVKEFVGKFGGGLVVISGPVHGPGQLAGTALADMLPVTLDPKARRRDGKDFLMRLTPAAKAYGFMKLGDSDDENAKAWDNVGPLPWYNPCKSIDPRTRVLAEHPSDTCEDGKTKQPLIAIRQYGKGEVAYLAFDETWRLRRLHGEKYYRQFWGQLIYRLGLGHATGSQKRFIARSDRTRYQVDDELRLTVDAYDEDFQPLTRAKLPSGKLDGELIITDEAGKARQPRPISIPLARQEQGQYELVIPLLESGDYRVRVKDSITGEFSDVVFSVTNISAERQSAVRNMSLEQDLAKATAGKVYDIKTLDKLPGEIRFAGVEKVDVKIFPLSSTWLCFLLLVVLAVGEWALRKWINVP
ncbi:MAG: hypothetical protein LLG01_18410 [Planctomycetaceae bacterium]|nr:hypothetical protein [Planctomycetaceae bacterium]